MWQAFTVQSGWQEWESFPICTLWNEAEVEYDNESNSFCSLFDVAESSVVVAQIPEIRPQVTTRQEVVEGKVAALVEVSAHFVTAIRMAGGSEFP